MTPEQRIDFVINGIHEPCGMPHAPGEGCTKYALKVHMNAAIKEAVNMARLKLCDHQWGIDGMHSNEYCKLCFISRPTADEWRVVYDQSFPEWHQHSRPAAVDGTGTIFIAMPQFVGHPGTYDQKANEIANKIVDALNKFGDR